MPVNLSNYLEMIKSFLNPEKWLFEIRPKQKTEETTKKNE